MNEQATVVVTGAGGQLGQEIVRLGREAGFRVQAADSKTLDITDYGKVISCCKEHQPDLVINTAAYNAVDDAEKEWKQAFRVNGLGVRNLALAANEIGAVLVHYSTDYVFDGSLQRPYTIADHPHPISRYGESKLLGEQFVRDLADRYFLIRVSWVFGKGNTNFAKKVLEWSNHKTELRVVDDQVSAPTYTVDLARATFDLVNTGRYGLYHITNSGTCSRYEWAAHILRTIGWKGDLLPARSTDFPAPARRPAYSVLDPFGTPETLGYGLPDWKDATTRFLQEVRS
jgi:dTDP-4-dehydrorhamnose reductase